MPLELIRQDITLMKTDAIVNAANSSLLGGGGVDGAIHRAAGPELKEYCKALKGCQTGEAKYSPGFQLPCRYIIHTVGPIWQKGSSAEKKLLSACYENSLKLALSLGCESIAFPLISSGAYGCPKAEALRIATDAIREFLMSNEMTVYLLLFDKESISVGSKLYARIARYIDDHYAAAFRENNRRPLLSRLFTAEKEEAEDKCCEAAPLCEALPCPSMDFSHLDDALSHLDDGFSQHLLRLIDEKGMTDVECYKRANIDRKLFSKIRSTPSYKPTKRTALALAIGLRLSLSETEELLKSAGLALSHNNKFDIIVEYALRHHMHDIDRINEVLFDYDQPLLGG